MPHNHIGFLHVIYRIEYTNCALIITPVELRISFRERERAPPPEYTNMYSGIVSFSRFTLHASERTRNVRLCCDNPNALIRIARK